MCGIAGPFNYDPFRWPLMMRELWFRRFIDKAPAPRAAYAEAI